MWWRKGSKFVTGLFRVDICSWGHLTNMQFSRSAENYPMSLFAPYWSPRAGVKTNKDASMAGTCWVQSNSLCRNITGHVQSSQPAKGARHPRRKGRTHRQADCRAWYRDPRRRSEAHDVRSDLHVRQVRWRNLPTGKWRSWHVALLFEQMTL